MPELDGYAVCRRIRERAETALLPVIMVTSSGEHEKRQAIEAGADDFVQKPFDQHELLDAGPLAPADQALPRHDQGAGRGAARAQPNARGASSRPARGARSPATTAKVPLAAARRGDRLVRRRLHPGQPPARGRDALRRPARLDELRRRSRAGGADARARRVPRHDRRPGAPLRRDGRVHRGRRRPALLQRSDRGSRTPPCARCAWAAHCARRWPS